MKTVSITELKVSLSEYLSAVRRGEEIIVTDRGKPLARITKVEGLHRDDERRARLAREGILRLRSGMSRRTLKPPPGKGPTGVLAALLEERRKGR